MEKKFINKKLSQKLHKKQTGFIHKHLTGILIISLSIIIVGLLFTKGIKIVIGKLNFKEILPTFNVNVDDKKHTNFLLTGIGGEGHSGENLTDTIIVASLNHKDKMVTMLSLPRDLFVNSQIGKTKINNIYEFALQKYEDKNLAMQELKKVTENITGLPIHYYINIDFKGFIEAIDTLGGIDIYLDKPFTDKAYPKQGTFDYETFHLDAGNQHLNGKTALKYVRSRHSTSDFDRSRRQQQVMTLVKEKAMKLGILTSPSKLKSLYQSFSNNVSTNLSWDEIAILAGIAKDIPKENILTQTIHNNPLELGGFLYVPDRAYFGNAFVLIPNGGSYKTLSNYQEIKKFNNYYHYNTALFQKNVTIEILNGTRQSSMAYYTKMMLARNGFDIIKFGNAPVKNIQRTTIYLNNETIKEKSLVPLLEFIPGEIKKEIPVDIPINGGDIIIVLGQDFASYYKSNPSSFY
ncbi:hypothetical protein A2229_03380 [Candidatus Peregrinibacteria bacterium RIFOXYA2_FULL_33_7]|nr:MAG: cell envelope-related transcriptional attenuator [Candidatus Peregrinibacteria bacterium GW2011_GWC2_33_13]OGJ48047.1 MAG: hypothetical protein A2229_03380 [Candidatus Peregrinibacteria bacterium RIFOXYA2_FULL_33_7]